MALDCSAVDGRASIPPVMTSGVPWALTAASFPSLSSAAGTVCAGGSRWVDHTAHLMGNVSLSGRLLAGPSAVVRGDIATVQIGDGVILCDCCVVRPPLRSLLNRRIAETAAVTIGDECVIGSRVVCEAVALGRHVLIEDDCVVGEWAELSDGVWLRSGCVVPAEMRLVPFVVYAGRPARPVATLDAALHQLGMRERVRALFDELQAPA